MPLAVMVASLVSITTSDDRSNYLTAKHHFNHPIILVESLDNNDPISGNVSDSLAEDHETKLMSSGFPAMFLQVCAERSFGRVDVVAFGLIRIPPKPGSYEINVPMSKALAGGGMSETKSRLYDYYFGCSPVVLSSVMTDFLSISQPRQMHATASTESVNGTRLFNGGKGPALQMGINSLVTVGAGSVRIRVHVQSTAFYHRTSNVNCRVDESEVSRTPILRETVDGVLMRVRKNRRRRMFRGAVRGSFEVESLSMSDKQVDGCTNKNDLSFNGESCDRNPRTAEVLARVRSRRAARGARGQKDAK
uniref:Uncharacterized protein n=1 Tax=Odontella aurita TaxID=265563 RepID=A0A7S4J059_9STRA|mmetsp:Transcript_34628/g.103440  ORF Transcript_34628/g.103440 Transcript_34628/m.103440 type:complete len:306 (+) Transcript_34628:838-1755(+)